MSFDYFVAIKEQNWPNADVVQLNLERLGYPIRLAAAPAAPLQVADFGKGVFFEGREVILEADIEQAKDADDPHSLFGYIAQCAAPNFKIANGDYFLVLTFRSEPDQVRAGLYLAAAMILSFDGYGFENQAERHGRQAFAEQLIAEASDRTAFKRPVPTYKLNPDFKFPEQRRSIADRVRKIFGTR